LQRIKDEINGNVFKSTPDMMALSSEAWRKNLTVTNYDQAWSMVYFLVQGADGKYQKPFVAFMQQVGRGIHWERAWLATMGDASQFEPQWKKYWLGLPESPTSALYAQADTAIFTSFLARATDQKQTFSDFDAFKTAASDENGLKIAPDEWLPHSLLDSALRAAEVSGTWSLEVSKLTKLPTIVETTADGTRVIGSFILRNKKVATVNTDVDELPAIIAKAQGVAEDGKKTDALAMLRNGIRQYPHSTAVRDAQKTIAGLLSSK
jgi:hypothetical protein